MSATPDPAKLYAERDCEALGEHYTRHISAMTSEHLILKSDIAAELAWRDAALAALQARLGEAEPVRSWTLNEETAALLRDTIGDGDANAITLAIGETVDDDGETQHGLYAYLMDYPEEGSIPLVASPAPLAAQAEQRPHLQERVQPWMLACFGAEIANDKQERSHRFLEEAPELVQACGATASEAHQLVGYVYGRRVGEPHQEVGGVMVTLAALCLAHGLDMHKAGGDELSRIWTMVEQIQGQASIRRCQAPPSRCARRMGPRRRKRPGLAMAEAQSAAAGALPVAFKAVSENGAWSVLVLDNARWAALGHGAKLYLEIGDAQAKESLMDCDTIIRNTIAAHRAIAPSTVTLEDVDHVKEMIRLLHRGAPEHLTANGLAHSLATALTAIDEIGAERAAYNNELRDRA